MSWFKRKIKTIQERVQAGELIQGVIIIPVEYCYTRGHGCKFHAQGSEWWKFYYHDLHIEISFDKKPQSGNAVIRFVAVWDQKGNIIHVYRVLEVLKVY